MRALGTTGGRRSIALPEVPTLAEGSGIAGLEVPVLIGLLAPTGTPEAVIDRLNREIGVIVRRPETREAWGKMGATTLVTDLTDLLYQCHCYFTAPSAVARG